MLPIMVSAGHSAVGALITILLLVRWMLLVQVAIPLIRWPWVPLLEALLWIGAWTSITPRGMSLKPPLLSLYLFALVVNNNSVIHQRLVIGVSIGHKMELQTVIKTLEKITLLNIIISHLIQSVM